MRWTISKCGLRKFHCDGGKRKYKSNTINTYECYIPAAYFDLVCENADGYGKGWNSASESDPEKKSFLEINGKRYCDDFTSGKTKKQQIIIGE